MSITLNWPKGNLVSQQRGEWSDQQIAELREHYATRRELEAEIGKVNNAITGIKGDLKALPNSLLIKILSILGSIVLACMALGFAALRFWE